MERLTAYTVAHLDTEGRKRTLVVGFLCEETQGGFDERIETFLRRKITCVARHRRPIERSRIGRIVSRLALHKGKLATHIVTDVFQFFRIFRPCHYVEMRPDRGKPERMCFVQVLVYPFLINLIAP